MPTKMPDAYVVVCTDLHHATGPYLGMKTATKVARAMTEAGECVYLPVRLTLADGTSPIMSGEAVREGNPVPWESKGYL